MVIFTGTYECKVDVKGRIMLPIAFRRKLGEVEVYRFVIKKELYGKKCLELFTEEEWNRVNNHILKTIKPYNPDDREFLRDFMEDVAEVECDPMGRLLIPGRLLKYAEIKNDTLLLGHPGKIEIWSPDVRYSSDGDEATKHERTERIMGNVTFNIDEL